MEIEMSSPPSIEWTINIGTILGVVFVAGAFYLTTKQDLKKIKEDLVMLNKAVAEIAVQNNRLDNQDQMIASLQKQQTVQDARIYELSRGRGFVRKEVDGEYSS